MYSNPKGIFQRLGLVSGSNALLAGASDIGLSLPAQSAAISLMQTSAALNQLRPVLDGIIALRIMQRLCDEIEESAVRIAAEFIPDPGSTDSQSDSTIDGDR